MHGAARDQLSRDVNRIGELKAAYDNKISATHLIETATEPVQKERPKRSIIVLVSALAAFLFSCIGVLLLEKYKDLPGQITQP
jgi:LPS O-antigen subunit length determinant protein (WzzB/FepE family)